jgi:uncharacterized SAM-binding protein YcdF (DUF218 family)
LHKQKNIIELDRREGPLPEGVIIVLGSANDEQGRLYSLGVERCELAVQLYKNNPGWKILLTGGYGSHFNTTSKPHALYMKKFLTARFIPEEDILEFAQSSNTIEDASLSKPIIQTHKFKFAVIVTSDYHLERARFLFCKTFKDIEVELFFITSKTDKAKCQLDLKALKKHEKEALRIQQIKATGI